MTGGCSNVAPAWDGNWTADCFIAWLWAGTTGDRRLVAVNYAANQSQCYVRLPPQDRGDRPVRFDDLMGTDRFDRDPGELDARGLYWTCPHGATTRSTSQLTRGDNRVCDRLAGSLARVLLRGHRHGRARVGGLSVVIVMFGDGSPMGRIVPNEQLRMTLTGFLFGCIGGAIALSRVGKESGAHVNPAVTLGFWLSTQTRRARGARLCRRAAGRCGAWCASTPCVGIDGAERRLRRHTPGQRVCHVNGRAG